MSKKIPTVPRVAERLRVAYLMVDSAREVHKAVFGSDGNFGANIDAVFVALAVLIGHSEGRPMSATKVALYLGMSRTTTQRKLAQLVELEVIERIGAHYYVTAARMASDVAVLDSLNKLLSRP